MSFRDRLSTTNFKSLTFKSWIQCLLENWNIDQEWTEKDSAMQNLRRKEKKHKSLQTLTSTSGALKMVVS